MDATFVLIDAVGNDGKPAGRGTDASVRNRPVAATSESKVARRGARSDFDRRSFVAVLRDWVARRIDEGARGRDFLFGDPACPRSIYRSLECTVTLSTLLKAETGDPNSCLHDLRHTWVTTQLDSCAFDPNGERQADAISAACGHESTGTTRESYFHGPESALSRALTAIEEIEDMSAGAAAAWLGTTATALRKRASRSGCAIGACARRLMAIHAANLQFPDVTSGFAFRAPLTQPIAMGETELTAADIVNVLVDATVGHTVPGIALRADLEIAVVLRILKCAARLAGANLRIADLQASLDLHLASIWSGCSFRPDLSRVGSRKLAALLSYFRASEASRLRAAYEAWRQCRTGPYLSLDRPAAVAPLLELLSQAGQPIETLRVAVADGRADGTAVMLSHFNSLLERFESLWQQSPRVAARSPRRGRPTTYLLIGEDNVRDGASAAVALGGINALMLSAAVLVELREETS